MKKLLVLMVVSLFATIGHASDLSDFVGYKIVAKKTVSGYVEENGSERKSNTSFEGCNHNRKIIFDDRTYLTCSSYSYSYSYRPEAIILTNGSQWIMLVNGNKYEMRN